jgi:hypothetical protein
VESTPRSPIRSSSGFDAAIYYRWLTVVTVALVLVQAILAGQGLFDDPEQLDVHGFVGNLTFLAVVGQAILAYLATTRRAIGRLELALNALLVLLVVAQLGLGYSGRDSADAAAWHVPNGVLIFGLASALVAMAWSIRSPE